MPTQINWFPIVNFVRIVAQFATGNLGREVIVILQLPLGRNISNTEYIGSAVGSHFFQDYAVLLHSLIHSTY